MVDPFSPSAAPRADGRRYPGAWPDDSCVVTFDDVRPLPGPVPELARDRQPVLAVGSNASPAQLRHKYLDHPDDLGIAMSRAHVSGLFVGFTPWRAGYGAYPATPVLEAGATTELMVQWLDHAQLADLDATEGGYTRTWLELPAVQVRVGEHLLDGVWAYVANSGPLVVDGHVVRMVTPWGDIEPGPWAVATQDELDRLLARHA